MENQDDILSTGTLYWFKSAGRGKIQVPLEILSEEQKQTLRAGLENERYPLDMGNRTLSVRYVWINNDDLYEVQVTDIDLSSEIKQKLRKPRTVQEKLAYRFTLTDMTCLQAKYIAGEVNDMFVRKILDNQPWRPWQYAEWKALKDVKIKVACECCGKTTNLVLQHTKQPRRIKTIISELVASHYQEFQIFMDENKNKIEFPLPKNKVPVCPKCGSSRVRHRMRRGNYICEKTRNYVTCKHEFIDPDYGYDERDIEAAEIKHKSMLRDHFCQEHGIKHQAIAISLEEIIVYLKMDHTKTLCNRCACIEDHPYLKLEKAYGMLYCPDERQ